MGMEGHATRPLAKLWLSACLTALAATLAGQEAAPAASPRARAASGTTHQEPHGKQPSARGHDKNGAATASTHKPKTHLPPLVAWQFVKNGNAQFVRSQHANASHDAKKGSSAHVTKTHHGDTSPPKNHGASHATRPAGANRYVCAVITCADSDCDIPTLLGLARKDVLELRLAGPFVNKEAVALLNRTLKNYHTSLILVLSHSDCESLRIRQKGSDDALDRRLVAVRNRARSLHRTIHETIGGQQRELLLASSSQMRDLVKRDRLRIIPGAIDAATGAIQWLQRRAQELPLSPVK